MSIIITSGVAGTWFVPTVNNEGADQPKDTGAVLSALSFLLFLFFFSWGRVGANCEQRRCKSA